jgi:hypothetical protein
MLAERLSEYKNDFAQITVHSEARHSADKATTLNMSLELAPALKVKFEQTHFATCFL